MDHLGSLNSMGIVHKTVGMAFGLSIHEQLRQCLNTSSLHVNRAVAGFPGYWPGGVRHAELAPELVAPE